MLTKYFTLYNEEYSCKTDKKYTELLRSGFTQRLLQIKSKKTMILFNWMAIFYVFCPYNVFVHFYSLQCYPNLAELKY